MGRVLKGIVFTPQVTSKFNSTAVSQHRSNGFKTIYWPNKMPLELLLDQIVTIGNANNGSILLSHLAFAVDTIIFCNVDHD